MLKVSDILCLLVALIADSSHVIEHVFELYMFFLTNMFRKEEIDESRHKQMVAIGKQPLYWVSSLFEKLYKYSQFSLPGYFFANPYFSIYTVPGPLYVPSRLYFFLYPQTSPKSLEIEQQENTVFPESIMIVKSPYRAVTKSLFSTISTISQLQPVTDIVMTDVSCEELAPEEQPIISEKARSIWFSECKLPMSFLKDLLRQLSGSVTLQFLRLDGVNMNAIEEDLDEFMESLLVTHPEMESEVAAYLSLERLKINLDNNQLSQTFKDKWLTRFRRTTIQLSVDDDGNRRNIGGVQIRNTSEDLTEEEINWLIQEQINPRASSCDQGPSSKNDDGNQRKFSSTRGKIQEETEKAEKLDASALALLCSMMEKVHETQKHEELSLEEINWLIQEEENKNKKADDPPQDENLKGKKTEDQPLAETLQGKKIEDQPLGETLQGKKTKVQPLGETLQGKKTEDQTVDETLQGKKTEDQTLGETLQGHKTKDQPLGETLQGRKTEDQPLGETLRGKKTEDQPLGETLRGKKTEEQSLDETLKRKKTKDQPPDGTLKRLKYEDKNPDEALKGKETE